MFRTKGSWIMVLIMLILSSAAFADQSVRGYMRQDGTYVQPYTRSSPNEYRYDNYSSHGNVNPYTGTPGNQRNEFSNPPAYNQSNPYAPKRW